MRLQKIAVLTSKSSWFLPYAKKFVKILKLNNISARLFLYHKRISKNYEVVFILNYYKIIKQWFLLKHKHNIVVHESYLPKGRGWAPLFWQILDGKNKIPISLFEATAGIDKGDIYLRDWIKLNGSELHDEIRQKQAIKTIELCLRFIKKYNKLRPKIQKGKPSYYKKRSPVDSELNINKTLKSQFNLLRIVNNNEFPAFFYQKGYKYILSIRKE